MSESLSNVSSTIRDQAGKILRLPFALRAPAPEYPQCNRVLRYWDELRGQRVAPRRAEVEPRHIATALEFTFVAELVAPQVARLRIAGNHLEHLLGMEPRGMPLGVFFTLDARTELGNALDQVSKGARAQLPIRAESGLGKPAMDGLLLLLPLLDDDGRITRVMGVFETHGQIGRSPRRFKLTAQKMQIAQPMPGAQPAVTPNPVTEQRHAAPVAPRRPVPQAEMQAEKQPELQHDLTPLRRGSRPGVITNPEAPAAQPPRGKPQLRLITGGRED